MDIIIDFFSNNFSSDPIAFSISVLALVLEIAIYQFKGMKAIVIGQCVSNFLILLTYFLGDGLSGAAVCAVATVHTFLIYYLYQKNDKSISSWFVWSFVIVYLVCSVVTYKSIIDIIPTIAAVLFALSVVQSKAWKYRIIIFANSILWISYDIIISAPIPMLVTHCIAVISVVVGIIRLDICKWIGKSQDFQRCLREK